MSKSIVDYVGAPIGAPRGYRKPPGRNRKVERITPKGGTRREKCWLVMFIEGQWKIVRRNYYSSEELCFRYKTSVFVHELFWTLDDAELALYARIGLSPREVPSGGMTPR